MESTSGSSNPNPININASLNIVAYRVLCLLRWLIEEPHSVVMLNDKFEQEPLTQRAVSDDTIGLYVNTLRQLGCTIHRPTRKNNYCYVLSYHPFGLYFNRQQARVFSQLKEKANQCDAISLFWAVQHFFTRLFDQSTASTRERLLLSGWESGRQVSYEGQLDKLTMLEGLLGGHTLLRITYFSPLKGKERFYFYATHMYCEDSALYLAGAQKGRDEPVSLRVDRIHKTEPLTELTPREVRLLQQLKQQVSRPKTPVEIRLCGLSETDALNWNMGETLVSVEDDADGRSVLVQLETSDWFRLKQKLLSTGLPFQVIAPESFKLEMSQVLQEMLAIYAS